MELVPWKTKQNKNLHHQQKSIHIKSNSKKKKKKSISNQWKTILATAVELQK